MTSRRTFLRGVPAAGLLATGWGGGRAPAALAASDATAALRALPPGQAVDLGAARVLGDFNAVARRFGLHESGPRARDYSLKMAWAPERRRALFTGANHGDPHRLNDVWEFDLAALSWRLLYAPDNPRSYLGLGDQADDVVFRDGVLMTARGGPAIIGHTWWGLTYHPGLRRLVWMNVWAAKPDALVEQVGGVAAQRYKGLPLWSFDPAAGAWHLLRASGAGPRGVFGGWLEYVDSLGGMLWHANNWQMQATWLFDDRSATWTNLQANRASKDFKRQAPGVEQVGYYDAARDSLIAQRGRATFHFDVRARQWQRVRDEPQDATDVPDGHDVRTVFVHEPASGHGLLVDFRDNAVWAYDPGTYAWRRLAPAGAPMPGGRKRLAYFDAAHGVLVVIDGTATWAYRYAPQA